MKGFVKHNVVVHMRFIDTLSYINCDNLTPLPEGRKFDFQLDIFGREKLFSHMKPDELLCRHAEYILNNYAKMRDESEEVVLSLKSFDQRSRISQAPGPVQARDTHNDTTVIFNGEELPRLKRSGSNNPFKRRREVKGA